MPALRVQIPQVLNSAWNACRVVDDASDPENSDADSVSDPQDSQKQDAAVDDQNYEVSLDEFFGWYCGNMFGQVSSATRQDDTQMVYDLARNHGVDVMSIDKIKKRFDSFDTDHSGLIDFNEFLLMLAQLLKAKSVDDISDKRIYRFWKEIDRDSSGSVTFPEFCGWYIKYFKPGTKEMETSGGPVEGFYNSFNPQVQRRRSVSADIEAEIAKIEDELSLGSASGY